MRRIEKPEEAEYAPYAIQYIGLLPDDGLALDHLQKNFEATRAFLLSLPEDKLLYRYAPDKSLLWRQPTYARQLARRVGDGAGSDIVIFQWDWRRRADTGRGGERECDECASHRLSHRRA